MEIGRRKVRQDRLWSGVGQEAEAGVKTGSIYEGAGGRSIDVSTVIYKLRSEGRETAGKKVRCGGGRNVEERASCEGHTETYERYGEGDVSGVAYVCGLGGLDKGGSRSGTTNV